MKTAKKHRQGDYATLAWTTDRELWRLNWRTLGYPFCGVYCIATSRRWPTKIGISHNPAKRLAQLQGSHWDSLDIFQYGYCANGEEAFRIEQKAHEILRTDGVELKGEWFDVRPERAFEIVKFAAELLGIEIREDIPDTKVLEAIRRRVILRVVNSPDPLDESLGISDPEIDWTRRKRYVRNAR